MLAEQDGRLDRDTPVLKRDAPVQRYGVDSQSRNKSKFLCVRFGNTYFALCKDPEFEGDKKTIKVLFPSKEYQVL